MKPVLALTFCGLACSAHAQSATYSITLSTPGPIQHGDLVQGTLRCAWQDPAGVGYAGGAFRLRMDGLGIADVLVPNNSTNGVNSETSGQRVGVPASEIPPGHGWGTVADGWTSGRRPKRAYLDGDPEPTGLVAGGGFRNPPNNNNSLHYSVEFQAGATYLTGRNAANVEIWIEHAQAPLAAQGDPLFFEPSSDFALFKFQVRAPLSGSGTVTITPEIQVAAIYATPDGAQDLLTPAQIQTLSASFTYVPAPGLSPLIGIALTISLRRRTRRRI
jgi:hypothetical protein